MTNTDPDRPGRPDLLDVITEALMETPVGPHFTTRQEVADLGAYLADRLLAAYGGRLAFALASGGTITEAPPLASERGPEIHPIDLPAPSGRVFVGPGGQLDLDNAFTYHAPTPDQIRRYGDLRGTGKSLARVIADYCPPGPERSTAIAKVREAIMWANASIACGEPDQG